MTIPHRDGEFTFARRDTPITEAEDVEAVSLVMAGVSVLVIVCWVSLLGYLAYQGLRWVFALIAQAMP